MYNLYSCWLFLISHYMLKFLLTSNHWSNQHLCKTFSWMIFFKSGSHLLSHAVSSIVPWAAWVLTIVFGMWTGVSPRRIATGSFFVPCRNIHNWTASFLTSSSLERRWSSRTFRYGYLVTTSPQLSAPPSAAPSLRLGHWLRAYPTPMVWRAVCTRPGNVFTATFWFAITSDSSFM